MNNNIEKDSTLEINLNEEYKIKIEKGSQFENSIFKEVYNTALKNVIQIVEHSDLKKYDINNTYDDFNNIIAFTGERGKGKSSSMISFRDALVKENKTCTFFNKYHLIKNKSFAKIEIIDPSLFRGGENLFEIILAHMFQNFQEKIKNNNFNISDDNRRAIIKHFQEVFENLQIINLDRNDLYKKESIEALSRLATSSNLRECFKKLVSEYLEKIENNTDFLIIAIDDFDLNISGGYEMLEDIRQFLIQSKIIILIACKIEQLKETVSIYYKKQNIKNKQNIKFKVKKYIDKLLPFERRIKLPDLKNQNQENFKIFKENELIFETKNNSFKINILRILFEQINIFQPLNVLNQNPILPETIRQTQNFISILYSNKVLDNLKNYIVEESYYNTKLNLFLSELENISDETFLILLNKKLIKLYIEKNGDYILDFRNKSDKAKFFKILINANIQDRLSIGDITFLLDEYENSIEIDEYSELNFISFLKLYISIRIKEIIKHDNSFLKYGYLNHFYNILSKDGKNRRDHLHIDHLFIEDEIDDLDSDNTLFFALWIQYLGEGYNEYRNSLNKDIFIDNYSTLYLSPFSIFNNCNNLEELSQYFEIDTSSYLYNSIIEWRDNSLLLKHLENPAFNIILIDNIREFRNLKIKEKLPDNYYDTISILYGFGMLYSLDKIEIEYNLNGLVDNLFKNPIFNMMLNMIISKGIYYKAVHDFFNKYESKFDSSYDNIDYSDFEYLINYIYTTYINEEDLENIHVKNISNEAINVLNDLKIHLNNKKITSITVGNRVNKLIDLNVDEYVTSYLNSLKYGLNNEETYEETKNDLNNFIDKIIYGQS